MEVVVTLAETAPAMVRKAGAKYMNMLIPQMLTMMTDLEDEEVIFIWFLVSILMSGIIIGMTAVSLPFIYVLHVFSTT